MHICDLCLEGCALKGLPTTGTEKKVICFLGMPGSGKSTQINFLQENLTCCKVFHVGKYASSLNLPKQKDGSLLQGLDEGFLTHVKDNESDIIILDGFPRSLEQLDKLITFAKHSNWQLSFIHIAFPKGKERETSLQRQIGREGSNDMVRLLGKIERAMECDLAVVDRVRRFNSYYEIDALLSIDEIKKAVASCIFLEYFQDSFSKSIIEEVRQSLSEGYTAELGRSFIYTRIWNNRFGAMQEPNDIDVQGNVNPMRLISRRYAVVKPDTFVIDDECLSFYRLALVVSSKRVSLKFSSVYDIYDTLNGVISIHPTEGKSLETAVSKLPKILNRYPMVKLTAVVNEELQRRNYFHIPLQVLKDFESINLAVAKDEYGGKPDMDYENTPSLELQMQLAKAAFFAASKLPSAPKRWSNKDIKILDSANWEENASALDDNSFREYLFKQANSRKGVKDAFIQFVINYRFAKTDKREQKATHQGWLLHMHLLESALQVSTNDLKVSDRVKLVIRTAMLFHDAGKTHNSNTPGCHQGVGAKLFQQQGFEFLSQEEVELGSFFIKWHDIFGRMYRGITEPSYTGAIHPIKVVEIISTMPLAADFNTKLSIMYAIWCGDVNSVATLNWILTLLPNVKRVIQEAALIAKKV